MPWAAAAGAAVGGAAEIGKALIDAEGRRKAASMQRDADKQANLMNIVMQVAARGGDPTAILKQAGLYTPEMVDSLRGMGVILPAYAGGYEGEKRLYEDAMAAYQAMGQTPPADLMAKYQAYVDQAQPAIADTVKLSQDLFSGEMERRRLASYDPVAAANEQAAFANRAAVDLALAETLNRIRAADARKGFVGAGSFATNRMLDATTLARQRAAAEIAKARVQNEMARYGIRESSLDTALKNVSMPFTLAEQQANLALLPEQQVTKQFAYRWQPFTPFRMQPTNFQQFRPLTYNYTPSALGAGLGAVSDLAGAGMEIWGERQKYLDANDRLALGDQGGYNAKNLTKQTRSALEGYYE